MFASYPYGSVTYAGGSFVELERFNPYCPSDSPYMESNNPYNKQNTPYLAQNTPYNSRNNPYQQLPHKC